ncbi:MAG: hypothetical protein KC492_28800, partial [Myxococcales bacterium]|nr:hypothetical protein [Myxococcales bacterium]
MKASPIRVGLPTEASAFQIAGSIDTVLAAFGWELGEHLNEQLVAQRGPGWLDALREVRRAHPRTRDLPLYRKRFNIHDVAALLAETINNSDSPFREYLPRGRDFYSALERIADFRNKKNHYEELPTLARVREAAVIVGRAAQAIGLPVTSQCAALVKRVVALQEGSYTPPVAVSADLAKELESLREASKASSAEVASLRAEAKRLVLLQGDDAQTRAELAKKLEDAEAARELAQAQLATALDVREAVAAKERSESEFIPGIRPGSEWLGDIPRRTVRLLANVPDCVDPATKDLLSAEAGDAAIAAARKWQRVLP